LTDRRINSAAKSEGRAGARNAVLERAPKGEGDFLVRAEFQGAGDDAHGFVFGVDGFAESGALLDRHLLAGILEEFARGGRIGGTIESALQFGDALRGRAFATLRSIATDRA